MRFNNNRVPSPPPLPIISERRRVAQHPYRENDTARYQQKSFPREGRERHNLFHENLITFIRGRVGTHTPSAIISQTRGPRAPRSSLAAEYFRALFLEVKRRPCKYATFVKSAAVANSAERQRFGEFIQRSEFPRHSGG